MVLAESTFGNMGVRDGMGVGSTAQTQGFRAGGGSYSKERASDLWCPC